jgi:phage-related minor tail protein
MILEAAEGAQALLENYGVGGAGIAVFAWLGRQFLKQNERMLELLERLATQMSDTTTAMQQTTKEMGNFKTEMTRWIDRNNAA